MSRHYLNSFDVFEVLVWTIEKSIYFTSPPGAVKIQHLLWEEGKPDTPCQQSNQIIHKFLLFFLDDECKHLFLDDKYLPLVLDEYKPLDLNDI